MFILSFFYLTGNSSVYLSRFEKKVSDIYLDKFFTAQLSYVFQCHDSSKLVCHDFFISCVKHKQMKCCLIFVRPITFHNNPVNFIDNAATNFVENCTRSLIFRSNARCCTMTTFTNLFEDDFRCQRSKAPISVSFVSEKCSDWTSLKSKLEWKRRNTQNCSEKLNSLLTEIRMKLNNLRSQSECHNFCWAEPAVANKKVNQND